MHNYIHPLQQHLLTQTKVAAKKVSISKDFNQVLSEVDRMTISKHARLRLEERNIHIDKDTWTEIGNKMQEAKEKGVTDAVVISDDVAFIVSTKNNTIITALPQDEINNKIFTNINGTIIL